MTKVTPFLMFNDQLEAAIAFYTATFPDSEVRYAARTGKDGPITSAEFVAGGQVFMGYNGGPHVAFSEGFSLYVDCEDQAEVFGADPDLRAIDTVARPVAYRARRMCYFSSRALPSAVPSSISA